MLNELSRINVKILAMHVFQCTNCTGLQCCFSFEMVKFASLSIQDATYHVCYIYCSHWLHLFNMEILRLKCCPFNVEIFYISLLIRRRRVNTELSFLKLGCLTIQPIYSIQQINHFPMYSQHSNSVISLLHVSWSVSN